MASKVIVNNLLSEMRNTRKQDPADPNLTLQVVGRRVTVAGDAPLIVAASPLDANTTHITWSVEGGDLYFTIDGTSAALAGSARHILSQNNLGTVWGVDFTNDVRVALKSGAPIFILSEVSEV